jgi:hypothetical protein
MVFDPALRHYPEALRVAEPQFASPEIGRTWREARAAVMGHLLKAVERSQWADRLVLRGSVVLKTWFPDAARDPGDLDFVFLPPAATHNDEDARAAEKDLVAAAAVGAPAAGVSLDVGRAATDYIWLYEGSPGRRVVFPWHGPSGTGGSVQVDVAFGDELHEPPVRTLVSLGGHDANVLTATKALSLSWKIKWLLEDRHVQGKDLYDAVLLAESTPLPPQLLRRTLGGTGAAGLACLDPARHPYDLHVDWEQFRTEYPGLARDENELKARLWRAIGPAVSHLLAEA